MSVTYLETFRIRGLPTLGIEDYEQPGEHFMPNSDHKRYQLWSGGCGIGQADTLEEARNKVLAFAKLRLIEQIAPLEKKTREIKQSIALLGDDVFNLGRFKVEAP
jgi:hypothetical protein